MQFTKHNILIKKLGRYETRLHETLESWIDILKSHTAYEYMQDCFRIKITIKTITGPLIHAAIWNLSNVQKTDSFSPKPFRLFDTLFVGFFYSVYHSLWFIDNKGMAILLTGYFQHVNNRNVLHSRSLSANEIEYDVAYRCD